MAADIKLKSEIPHYMKIEDKTHIKSEDKITAYIKPEKEISTYVKSENGIILHRQENHADKIVQSSVGTIFEDFEKILSSKHATTTTDSSDNLIDNELFSIIEDMECEEITELLKLASNSSYYHSEAVNLYRAPTPESVLQDMSDIGQNSNCSSEYLSDNSIVLLDKSGSGTSEDKVDSETVTTDPSKRSITSRGTTCETSFVTKVIDGQTFFTCVKCDFSFFSKRKLLEHSRVHRKVLRYKCSSCPKMFRTKGEYVNHNRVHTGERPFACNLCTKSFKQRSQLRQHLFSHTGFKLYTCDRCQKKYSTKNELIRHVRIHVGFYPFRCDKCGLRFHNTTQLKFHVRDHHEIDYFKCKICFQKFDNLSQLQRHEQVHLSRNIKMEI